MTELNAAGRPYYEDFISFLLPSHTLCSPSAVNAQLHSSRHECVRICSCVFLMHSCICLSAFMLSRLVSFSYDMPQMREQCSAEAVSQRRAPVHAVDVCRFVKTAQSKSQQSCNKKKLERA